MTYHHIPPYIKQLIDEVEGDVLGCIQTGSGDVEVSGSVSGSIKTGSGDITVGR